MIDISDGLRISLQSGTSSKRISSSVTPAGEAAIVKVNFTGLNGTELSLSYLVSVENGEFRVRRGNTDVAKSGYSSVVSHVMTELRQLSRVAAY